MTVVWQNRFTLTHMSGQMSQPSRKGETSNTCIVVLFSKHLMKHFHQTILLQIKANVFKPSEATLKKLG